MNLDQFMLMSSGGLKGIRMAKRDQNGDSGQKCDSIVHDVNDSSS